MKPLMLSWWLLCGADAATTHHVLTTGGQEMLLPSQNPYVVDGMVLAQAAMGAYANRELRKTHPKIAMGVMIGMVAFRAFAVTNNTYQIIQHHR